jgi:outer membrane protein OmpA-like peptidoglycan-associated protein
VSWRSAALAAVLVPAIASAEPTRNIDLTVFDPTPTTSGTAFQVQTAEVGDSGELVVSAAASYASNPLVLGTDATSEPLVKNRTMLSVGTAYAFADRFEAGAHMPLYMQSGETVVSGTTTVPAADGAAAGNLTLHGKVRFVHTPKLHVGLGASVTLPTASDSEFAGADLPTGRVLALASYMPAVPLAIHVNVGGVLRKSVQFANVDQGSGIAWGVGASFRAFERVFFQVEAYGDAIPDGARGRPTTAMPMGEPVMLRTFEGLAGARVQLSRQASVGIAAGRGLTGDVGTPDLRGVLTFAFAPSARELPPLHRPPSEAPADPTKDDTDYDRIVDANDKCPKDREDKDGFEDDDGCPDPDNDKDGVADAADKCPDKAEKINGKDDNDGCPDTGDSLVISNPDRLELLESVLFTGGGVAKDSANVMNQLAATLRARADIRRLRITVHVNPGKNSSARKDQALSDKRAEAVKAWLVKWGVDADRVEAKGFGSTKLLVPATQKGAAMINDRVELIILERN